jgi:N-acetyl-alpha-D-glucosaminyl L-malate synthase BshA
MRIGVVCHPTYGGSGVIAVEVAEELAQRGHDIHLICYERPVRLNVFPDTKVHFHKVHFSTYPLFPHPFYTLALTTKISQVIEEFALDLIHIHYCIPHTPAAIFARFITHKNTCRIITTLHGTDVHLIGIDPAYLGITKFCIEQSEGVTTVSEYLKQETISRFHLGDKYFEKIKVVNNFIDPERFKRKYDEAFRRRFARKDEKIILHISNFRKVKNVPAVIEVFSKVVRHCPSRLILIGDGPEIGRVDQLVKEYNLSDRVFFLGEILNPVPYYSISDLLLLPSRMESFGLVALEAMGCEVPVVAYKIGGLSEVVEDGGCGFLVTNLDSAEMVEATLKILKDDRLREEFGKRGRKIATEVFSHKKKIAEYEAYYRKVLQA